MWLQPRGSPLHIFPKNGRFQEKIRCGSRVLRNFIVHVRNNQGPVPSRIDLTITSSEEEGADGRNDISPPSSSPSSLSPPTSPPAPAPPVTGECHFCCQQKELMRVTCCGAASGCRDCLQVIVYDRNVCPYCNKNNLFHYVSFILL